MQFDNIKIGLIGFGSIGKQLFNYLIESNCPEENIYIFADDANHSDESRIYKFNDFKEDKFKKLHFIPTLGYLSKSLRLNILNYLKEHQYKIFTFIHPSSYVSKFARIGKGVIVYPMCNIDQGTFIGDGTIILNSSIIAHDTRIGCCTYLAPGVCLSGFVNIGDLCFLGTSSTISNNVKVGDNTTIAIGTCVTDDIAENSFAIGNPFKIKDFIKLT